MKLRILLFLVFCAGSCHSLEAGEGEKETRRQGRILFATTTTSTSTVTTYSVCWKASVAAQTAVYGCKRKRSLHSLLESSVPKSDEGSALVSPSRSLEDEEFSIEEVCVNFMINYFSILHKYSLYLTVLLKLTFFFHLPES